MAGAAATGCTGAVDRYLGFTRRIARELLGFLHALHVTPISP